MHTDLDRLHAVALGQLGGRGCGKTFLQCHHLAGYIQIGEMDIVCTVTRLSDIDYILPMLNQVFHDHGLPLIQRVYPQSSGIHAPHKWKCGDRIRVTFVPNKDLEEFLRSRDVALIYMRHND